MSKLKVELVDTSPYSFDQLVGEFKWLLKTLPDARTGSNTKYKISDAALGAFSVFFMQSPSFLAHQARMQQLMGDSNARSLFQIEHIPSDNQIRNILDLVPADKITPMFDFVFNGLNSIGYFEHYRSINKTILIALDGVNYFSSKSINCDQCNTKFYKSTNEISYFHSAITPIIVAPDNPNVISLTPEFLTPQDGHDKQDGEHAAAKRWLAEHGAKYKALGATILGDDLYAHHPFCEAVRQQGLHFLLTCKPDSHKKLYEAVNTLSETGYVRQLQVHRTKGERVKKYLTDTYRFVNYV